MIAKCSRTSYSQAASSSMISWIISSSLSMSRRQNKWLEISGGNGGNELRPAAPTRQTGEHLLCTMEGKSDRHVLAWVGEPPAAKKWHRQSQDRDRVPPRQNISSKGAGDGSGGGGEETWEARHDAKEWWEAMASTPDTSKWVPAASFVESGAPTTSPV
jgi:hypothetical protein